MQNSIATFLRIATATSATLLGVVAFSGVRMASAQSDTPVPKISTGTYVVTMGGQRVGEETFSITKTGWTTKGDFSLMGRESRWEVTAERKDGTWHAALDLRAGERHFDLKAKRDGNVIALEYKGKTKEVDFGEGAPPLFFENLVWGHMIDCARELAHRANTKKLESGFQIRAISISSSSKMKLDLLSFERIVVELEDEKHPLYRFIITLGGRVELAMLSTTDGLPLRMQVTTQRLDVTLKGYEKLPDAAPQPSTPVDAGKWRRKLSKARHEVAIEKKVMIPMRDGVKLAADVYRPKKAGKYPVVMSRTPYRRQGMGLVHGMYFARRGYVYIAQDCRGRFDSEGDWYPLRHETKDGYDTLDWIAKQTWSTGKVGMIGASYVGWVQWYAAKSGHPALKCIVPLVSPPDPHGNIPYEGGAFFMISAWWAKTVEDMAKGADKAVLAAKKVDWGKALGTLPLTDIDEALGLKHPFLDDWVTHPSADDPYWKDMKYEASWGKINVPALNVTGWFDSDQPGALTNFVGMRKAKRQDRADGPPLQWLIVGPWSHAINTSKRLGPFRFGDDAVVDMNSVYLRWFDFHLKGIDNGVATAPSVYLFNVGDNKWETGNAWPSKRAKMTRLYLAGKNSHKRDGGGRLALAPSPGEPVDYIYDPADPPKLDMDLNNVGEDKVSSLLDLPDREDVLDYTSPPLAKPVDITGPLETTLTVSTDAPTTDFAVIVMRITKDGKGYGLGRGIRRIPADTPPTLHERGSTVRINPLAPRTITLDCWATSHRLEAGDRIRVLVQSSLFPAFDRNLNTGEPAGTSTKMKKAKQQIRHDRTSLSFIELPVVSEAGIVFAASDTAQPPGPRLDPKERALLERGKADEPLPVVKNDDREGDAFLRRNCRAIDPAAPSLARLISRMLATVRERKGTGIAAPQVGIDRRLVLVQHDDRPGEPFVAYLNPTIVRRSPATVVDWEGCLSIPAGYGKVKRARAIVVAYDTPDGERKEEKFENWVARIFQHEIDHLDGVLFIDRREPGELIDRETLGKIRRAERERKAKEAKR